MYSIGRQISRHASRLRQNATDVERSLWTDLRNRQLGGFKFRRRWTVGCYIADFACLETRLIVELDGGQHIDERDAKRTAHLQTAGFQVMRFWNSEVVENREGVLETILAAILGSGGAERKTLTQPAPG